MHIHLNVLHVVMARSPPHGTRSFGMEWWDAMHVRGHLRGQENVSD